MSDTAPKPRPAAGIVKMVLVAIAAFAFTFSLIPLYRIACEKVFGIRLERTASEGVQDARAPKRGGRGPLRERRLRDRDRLVHLFGGGERDLGLELPGRRVERVGEAAARSVDELAADVVLEGLSHDDRPVLGGEKSPEK